MQPKNDLVSRVKQYIESNNLDENKCKMFQELKSFELTETKEENGNVRIAGYLSTFGNVDRESDIVSSQAFDETIKTIKKLPMLRDHIADTDHMVGSFDVIVRDQKGLYVEGSIELTEKTEHLIRLIKGGHINTLSMGGMFTYDGLDKNGNYIISEVILFEGSIVVVPANPEAIFVVKAIGDIENGDQVPDGKETQLLMLKGLQSEMTDREAIKAISDIMNEMEQ